MNSDPLIGKKTHFCANSTCFLDQRKLAAAVVKIGTSIFVNEDEVNRAFSLASKRQFTKVSSANSENTAQHAPASNVQLPLDCLDTAL